MSDGAKYKWNWRPKTGLKLNILKTFLSEKEIENLVIQYMEAKKKLYCSTGEK